MTIRVFSSNRLDSKGLPKKCGQVVFNSRQPPQANDFLRAWLLEDGIENYHDRKETNPTAEVSEVITGSLTVVIRDSKGKAQHLYLEEIQGGRKWWNFV